MPIQDFKGMINNVVPNQIIGDGIAGRIIRVIKWWIKDGTDADTIKVMCSSVWNGDTRAEVDNVSKGARPDCHT